MPEEAPLVWTRPERGARGPAARHTRTALAAAAVELADGAGLFAVSMRRVAEALGTGQSSLYRHVSGREDLLDLMTDAVTAEVDLDVPYTGDAVADLVALAERTRSVHLRHPWWGEVPPEPLRLGPHGLDYLEYALGAMAPLRISAGRRTEVVGVLNGLVTLLTRAELQHAQAESGRRAAQAAYLAQAAADERRPHLAAVLGEAPPAVEPSGLFARTVRRALTGLLRSE